MVDTSEGPGPVRFPPGSCSGNVLVLTSFFSADMFKRSNKKCCTCVWLWSLTLMISGSDSAYDSRVCWGRKSKHPLITSVLFIQVSRPCWPLHSLPRPPPQSQLQGAR